jgi:hypothetical protein
MAMRNGRPAALTAAFALLLPATAAAQTVILEGRISGAEGAPIGAAVVAATGVETGEQRTVVTRGTGEFRILGLSPGTYRIAASAAGYAARQRVIELFVGQRALLHLELEPAVVALAPLVADAERTGLREFAHPSVSTTVQEREIRHLPLSTRNAMDLAALAPGIRSYRPLGGQTMPSAGPLRGERFVNFYIDGVQLKNYYDGNLLGFPQLGTPLPADALREFRVHLHTYDPAFTHGASYVIDAVSHRGTNRFESSVFGMLQHRAFVAGNAFLEERPNFTAADFRRHQGGLTLRGPIVRDRLFYAASYELSSTVNYVSVVPPRPAADPSRWDAHAGVFPTPNSNHTALVRLTSTPTRSHTLEAIATLRHMETQTMFGAAVARESAVADENTVGTLNLRHRWLAAADAANELSLQVVGWSNRGRALYPQPVQLHPGLRIGAPAPAFSLDERHVRVVNRSTLAVDGRGGSHVFDVGAEVSRVSISNFFPNLKLGTFDFRGAPVAGIAVGARNPDSDSDALTRARGWSVGLWVGDQWRPLSRLTLNLGVRYDADLGLMNNEMRMPWVEDAGLASLPELQGYLNHGDRASDLNNFSPRVALSWDVAGDGSTMLRGGYGIMHDRVPAFVSFQEQRDAYWRTYVFVAPGTTDPDVLRQRVREGEGRHVSLTLLSNTLEAPQNRQWSLGLARRITRALALNVDFVRQDVSKLFAALNLNWQDLSVTPPRRALSQDHGDIGVWDDFARARYRALLTQLTWQPSPELRVNVAYTLGDARAEWDVANQAVPAAAADRFYVMQRISGDERHRVVTSGLLPLPFGTRLSLVATMASPRPYLATTGVDANRNGAVFDDWLDERRYRLPANEWRNWYRVVDMRLSQHVPVGRMQITAHAEAFNLFNAQNYSAYDGSRNSAAGENLRFGQPSGVFGTRQLQLGLRADF